MFKKILIACTLTTTLSSCVANNKEEPILITTRATIYKDDAYQTNQKSIFIMSYDNIDSTLEFKSFKENLENTLQSKGLIISYNPLKADYIGFLAYKIDNGTTSTSSYTIPQWGRISGGTTYHSGTVMGGGGMASYNGSSYSPPVYGVTGQSTGTITSTTYSRFVRFDIFDRQSLEDKTAHQIYQIELKSRGTCSSLTTVYPYMIQSLEKVWPGKNGMSEEIDLPFDKKC